MRRSELKVNISELPLEGLNLNGRMPPDAVNRLLASRGGDLNFTKPICWWLSIRRSHDNIIAEIELKSEYQTLCSRCVEMVTQDYYNRFVQFFLPRQEDLRGSRPGADDVEQLSFFAGDEIDFAPVVMEQIFLSLPAKPLCRPDCQGLCLECYANLNEGSCNCDKLAVDPRWAALKDFKKK